MVDLGRNADRSIFTSCFDEVQYLNNKVEREWFAIIHRIHDIFSWYILDSRVIRCNLLLFLTYTALFILIRSSNQIYLLTSFVSRCFRFVDDSSLINKEPGHYEVQVDYQKTNTSISLLIKRGQTNSLCDLKIFFVEE